LKLQAPSDAIRSEPKRNTSRESLQLAMALDTSKDMAAKFWKRPESSDKDSAERYNMNDSCTSPRRCLAGHFIGLGPTVVHFTTQLVGHRHLQAFFQGL